MSNPFANYDNWLQPPDPEPMGDCPECDGNTAIVDDDNETIQCPECNGTGEVTLERCDTCNSYTCRCDDDYEAWKDSQYD